MDADAAKKDLEWSIQEDHRVQTPVLKVENAADPNLFAEMDVVTTVANAWEPLNFDFSTVGINTAVAGGAQNVGFARNSPESTSYSHQQFVTFLMANGLADLFGVTHLENHHGESASASLRLHEVATKDFA